MRWWKRCGVGVVLVSVAMARAEWVELPASRDVWLSGAIASETDTNMGKTDRLKLKVWQELAIVDFDVAAAKSRQVVGAELWLRPVGQARVGQQRGTDLNWITVSTVSGEWVEGLGQRSYRQDPKGHGATFNEASFGRRAWAWPGSKVFDVILGNGQTFRYDGRLQPAGDGWFKMSIPVRFVHALVAGASHGLAILDGSTSPAQNAYIASRESGQGPYLRVQLGEPDEVAPRPPGELKVAPAPMAATPRHGAVQVRFRRPADAAAYHVRIDGQVVARWQIPYPRAEGSLEQFEIVDLPAGKQIKLEVAVADAAGNVSPFVSATGQTSAALSVPVLPASDWRPKGGPARISGGRLRVWALPAIVKVDPIRGGVLGESARPRFDQANAVWDAAEGLIRLVAARGEIVSFQLAIEAKRGRLSGVGVKVSPLRGPAGAIARRNVRLFRNWYVRAGGVWHSEYAVPLRGRFDIPTSDNGIRAQRLQAVTVDVHVPRQARAGRYDGRVTVEAAGLEPLELGLRVVVYDVVIPDELNFNPELNCYRGPAEAGTKRFFEAHRLAHYHRCTINRVPYSQSGKVHADMIPK
ncbi:MAG: glycoside hydrolase domain-containing protein, partial [Phycisphaerae bacterium]